MATATEEKPDILEMPIFSSKKSLLPFDEYAARQKVSRGVIQECAKLGIVQVRRHKDQTYVVDLPLSAYRHKHDIGDMVEQPDVETFEQAQEVTTTIRNIMGFSGKAAALHKEQTKPRQKNDDRTKVVDSAAVIDETVELIERKQKLAEQSAMLGKLFGTKKIKADSKAEPLKQKINQAKGRITIPDLHIFAQEEKIRKTFVEQKSAFSKFRIPLLRRITEALSNVNLWRVTSLTIAGGLIISIGAYMSASSQRASQQRRLEAAYAGMNSLMSDYDSARQQAREYQYELLDSRFENEKTKKNLADQIDELNKVKEKLYKANKDLTALEQYNAETLADLNNEIKNITSQLPTKSRR